MLRWRERRATSAGLSSIGGGAAAAASAATSTARGLEEWKWRGEAARGEARERRGEEEEEEAVRVESAAAVRGADCARSGRRASRPALLLLLATKREALMTVVEAGGVVMSRKKWRLPRLRSSPLSLRPRTFGNRCQCLCQPASSFHATEARAGSKRLRRLELHTTSPFSSSSCIHPSNVRLPRRRRQGAAASRLRGTRRPCDTMEDARPLPHRSRLGL